MQKYLDIKTYLGAVCDQIRWKKAHAVVEQELENHINDQRNAYLADGMDEEAAVQKAVLEMGDPVVAGQQLDRVHRPRPDWGMLVVVILLITLGGAMQYILSHSGWEAENQFVRFLIYMPVGAAAFVIACFADYSLLGKYPKALFFAYWTVCLGAVVFMPSFIGRVGRGTYLTLPFLPLFAGIMYCQRAAGYKGLWNCLLFYGLTLVATLAMSPIGGPIVFTVAYLVMMTVALFRNWFQCKKSAALAILYAPPVLLALGALLASMWLRNWLRYIIAPQLDPLGRGYLGSTIRAILSVVKPWGTAQLPGMWADYTLETTLPGWSTHSMLTYLMGRFGAVVGVLVASAVLALIIRLFMIVFRQKSSLGFIVSLSVVLAITIQSAFYVLENFGLVVFGSSLPLLSYGAVGFVVNMALLGLALSAVRRNSIVTDSLHHGARWQGRVFRLFYGRIVIDLRGGHTA